VRKSKPVGVYLDVKLSTWLEGKAMEGYKKSAFVRCLIAERMKQESASTAGGAVA